MIITVGGWAEASTKELADKLNFKDTGYTINVQVRPGGPELTTALTAGMASKHGVALRRVTQKARNPADKANADELAILRQFEAAIPASTNPPPPIVTNFVAGAATFFAPIILSKELCLQCHGVSGKDIAPENLAVIQRLYPQDEATGFKLGDLRGAWRVDFPLATLSAGR